MAQGMKWPNVELGDQDFGPGIKLQGRVTNTLPATPRADGERIDVAIDGFGQVWGRGTTSEAQRNILVSKSPPAGENSHIISNAAARLRWARVNDISGVASFLQLHVGGIPAPGAAAEDWLPLPANGASGWSWGEDGDVAYTSGAVWVISSTPATYTAVAGNVAWGRVGYQNA